jgi:hypothetical protein
MTWSALAYAQAVQRTRIVMFSSFVRVIAVLSLVAAGGALGNPNWACVGAGVGFGLHSLLTIVGAGRATDLPVAAYLLGVARPLLPSAVMFVAVVAIQRALGAAGVALGVSLAIQIISGALIYVAGAFVSMPSTVGELLRLAREALRRGQR